MFRIINNWRKVTKTNANRMEYLRKRMKRDQLQIWRDEEIRKFILENKPEATQLTKKDATNRKSISKLVASRSSVSTSQHDK